MKLFRKKYEIKVTKIGSKLPTFYNGGNYDNSTISVTATTA